MTLTMATLTALFLPAAALIGFALLATRRIAGIRHSSPAWPDQTANANLSAERYRPMLRLLDRDDIRFLEAQPGTTPAMVSRFRRQRCQIFRGYLECLERDFRRASDALVFVMIQAQSDRRDLIPVLIGHRSKFAVRVFVVRCRLMLYRWNVGREPVARLVGLVEGLQRELQALAPIMQGTEA